MLQLLSSVKYAVSVQFCVPSAFIPEIVNEIGLLKGGEMIAESPEQFFTINWPVVGGQLTSTIPAILKVWFTVSQIEKEWFIVFIVQTHVGSV